ncbi:MAG: hypothetical protein ETSY2_25535 [Candidatus Entotheonella gemina]|uniref:Peptidase A2 domain-containing protein n=1 Tax=Candidatus Entotheonella gemina TaxID=1429439 RepID=W4M5U0_9BACT|nr:MAG: hypothetical protein ETSY2_25535 [Candidatus Entotheonella gemina]
MQINGEWLLCDDGIVRPIIRGEILSGDGSWVPAEFLVDTGADRTVFSALIFRALHPQSIYRQEHLGGLGGTTEAVVVETQLRFGDKGGNQVVFRGQYAAVTELETLDICVLGRDIIGLFVLIVDQPGNVVCLLSQRHQYIIEQS